MAQVYFKDPYGLTHGFDIAGDAPTADEQAWISATLTGKTYTPPENQTSDWDNTGIMGAYMSGVGAGANQFQAGTAGLAGLIGKSEQMEAERKRQNEEAGQYVHPEGGFFDQSGMYDKAKFLAYQAGVSSPGMAAGIPSAYAGATAGAAAGSVVPGVGTAVGGFVGGAIGLGLGSVPQNYNENLNEQIATFGKIKSKEKALNAAIMQSGLEGIGDRVTLGMAKVSGKAIPNVVKEVFSEAIKGGVKKAAVRAGEGAVVGFSQEAITEAAQQALTRWQAEKPLGDKDAMYEYLENAVVGGLIGLPLGGVAGGVGAVVDARETDKKKQIEDDIQKESAGLFGTDPITNIGANAENIVKRAEGEVIAEDALAGPKDILISDTRPRPDLIEGYKGVERPAPPEAPAPKQAFSEDEYRSALDAMRGEKAFHPDKIKTKMKFGRVKAKAIFDEIKKRGDAAETGPDNKYLKAIEKVQTPKAEVTRSYKVGPINKAEIAPFNIKLQGGRDVGVDFKTAEEAYKFADAHKMDDFVVTESKSPKSYAVYEETTSPNGERPSVRHYKSFATEAEAKQFANSLNPAYAPKTNEAKVNQDRIARVDNKINEIIGRYRSNIQTLADRMLGKGASIVDLAPSITAPTGQGLQTGDIIEGQTVPLQNGLHRIDVAMGIYQPNMSPDQQQQVMDSVAHHEIFHVAKAAGLFTPKEYQALLKRANQKINGKNYTYLERAQVRTQGAPEGAGLNEEALAEMFRDYMRDPTSFDRSNRGLMERLWDFIRSLGGMFKSATEGGDVMEALSSGKLAERGPVSREDMYGPYYSTVKIPGFYSATADYFETIAKEQGPDRSYPGQQWLGMLKNAKGIKQEEIDWLGLPDWLRGQQKVSVRNILEYIGANSVDVHEQIRQGEPLSEYEKEEVGQLYDDLRQSFRDDFGYSSFPEWLDFQSEHGNSDARRFRELNNRDKEGPTHGITTQTGGTDYSELIFHMPHLQPQFAVGAHFEGFPNILAHGRFDTRTIDGKKMLFIEEMQSDLHQQGKKKGYTSSADVEKLQALLDEDARISSELDKFQDLSWPEMTAAQQDAWNDLIRQRRMNNAEYDDLQSVSEIPDAPFKTTWSDFVIKRLVRYASENGFDAIAWNAEPEGVALSEHYGEIITSSDEEGKPIHYTDVGGQNVTGIINFYTKRLANDVKKLFNKPEFGNAQPRIVEREATDPDSLNLEELFPTKDDFFMVMQEVEQFEPDLRPYSRRAQQIARNQRDFDPMAALNQAEFPVGKFVDVFNEIYPEYAVSDVATATIDSGGNPNVSRWVLDITPELKETALGKGFPMFSSVKAKPDPAMIETAQFKRWFAGSKVVDDEGKPLVIYHGTTRDFDYFKTGHLQGYVGAGIYFTDSPDEASQNYAHVGSGDLLTRIEQIAEQRFNEAQENYDYEESDVGPSYDEIYDQVAKENIEHQGAVIPAMMALKNPFIMGSDKETQFDKGMRDQLIRAVAGAGRDFLNVNPEKLSKDFNYNYENDEVIGAQDIRDATVNSGALADAIDPESGMEATPEVFRQALELMGFDGIIDRSAGKRWRFMASMKGNEVHYIAFKPTQIKSIHNNGAFSEEDARILYSSLRMNPAYSAQAAMGTRVPTHNPARTIADIEAKITYNTVAPKLERLLNLTKLFSPQTSKSIAEGTIIGLQDKYQPLAKLIDRVRANRGSLSNDSDAYLKEQLMHGEIDHAITTNEHKLYDPLVEAVRHLKVTQADINELLALHPSHIITNARGVPRETSAVQNILNNYKEDPRRAMAELYLYAQHAKERNAVMRERNADLAAQRPDQFSAGSGMSDAEADSVLGWMASKPFANQLMSVVNPNSVRMLFRKIITSTNDIRVAGDLNPDFRRMVDSKGQPVEKYVDYAPLRGYLDENPDHANDELANAFARAGKGMKIMGKEDFSATGRQSEAANIIGNAILQNMEAITRAGKNKVGLSFLKMLEDNMGITLPNETNIPNVMSDFAEIVPLTKSKPVYSKNSGKVVMSPQTVKMDPDIMVVKRGGQEIGIKLKDNGLKNAFLGSAMLGTTGQSALIKGLLKLNRFLAAARTSYNPEFMISNMLRDLEAAALNLTELEMKGLRRQVVGSALPAVRGVYRSLRDGKPDPWRNEFEEFAKHGGKTAFMGIRDLEGTLNRIGKQLEEDPEGNFFKIKKGIFAVSELVEAVNDAVENGTRVAAYKAIKERLTSMSKDPVRDADRIRSRAAFIAKNLTVNFNMGGTQKPLMQALYLFYNASLQGTFALVNPLIRSKKVRALWLTAIAGGVLQDALMSLVSDIADDGEKEYDKIPEYILETNMILPNPFVDRGYFKIPMPYLFNSAWNAGRAFSRTLRGGYSIGEGMGSVMGTVADSVNPWGGGGSFLNFVAPTIADPMVDLVANKNFMGSPIAKPENPFGTGTDIPSQRYWNNTSPFYVGVAEMLDTITGGDNVLPGKMSFSPNQYEYIFEWFGGGAWSTVVRSLDMLNPVSGNARAFLKGDEVSANDVPFLRRVVGNITTREDLSGYIEKRDEVLAVRNALKEARKQGDSDTYQRIMERYPDQYKLAARVNSIEARRRKLGAQINKVRDSRNLSAEEKEKMVKVLKQRQEALVNQANAMMDAI